MATKRGLGVWIGVFICVLGGVSLVGCGGNSRSGGPGLSVGDTAGGSSGNAGPPPATAGTKDTVQVPTDAGWSIRDTTPYSRTEHATVLDEARDRMLVIGGGAGLDIWALPLSGPEEKQWAEILPKGDSPPADESNVGMAVSAIYDPFGQRLLVLRADSYQFKTPRMWELSLDDSPTWHELTLEGPQPGAQLDQGKMVLDRSGKRVLIVGGGLTSSGTWALSLEGPTRWSRVADAPAQETFTRSPFLLDINAGALFVDSLRERVVLVTGGVRDTSHVWTLPLAGGDWALESSDSCGADYDTSSTYDSVHDRVIFVGSDCGISSYSLATGAWQTKPVTNDPSLQSLAMSSVDDPQRGRALFFSGGIFAGNATTALRYDDLSLSVLVPNTLGTSPGGTNGVWDEQRQALVAFGADESYGGARTRAHGLGATDRWLDVAAAVPPFSVGVYDEDGKAVIAVGHPYRGATRENVARLSSVPGSDWEIIPASGGPEVRSWPVAVYDSARHRLVVHGGQAVGGYPPRNYFDDTWSLSLNGDPKWTELTTTGDSGGARSGQTAIYDPVAQRLISYGGSVDAIANYGSGDLHQLMLDDSLEWSELHAAGMGPARADGVLTVYDPQGQRMLALDRTHLFALTLNGDPTWHRFCEPGMGMPGTIAVFVIGNGPAATLLGLAPDGLFAALGDGTFRFGLDTPYCD